MKESNLAASNSSHLHKSKILFISIAFLAFVLVISTAVSDAQNVFSGQSLEVSPPSQEISADPGEKITATATVRNKSNKTVPVTVRVEDFTATGDEGQVELTADSPYSASKWTKVSPQKFDLEPGEEREVTASISVPKSGVAGGHYGSFVFSIVPEGGDPNSAAVAQEVASLFLLRVNGDVYEKLELSSFTTKSFFEYGPVPFEMKFINTGNVHTKPYGLINITDMFGNRVTDIVVPGKNILPNANRVIESMLNKKFLFGKYTATAIMYYGGSQNVSLTAQTSFIVFPWKIALGLLVIIFILVKMKKRLKKASKAIFGK
jgi:hypothetical protein